MESIYPRLLDLVLQSTLILLLTGAGALLLRRKSASSRHTLWTMALSALLVLPGLTFFMPHRIALFHADLDAQLGTRVATSTSPYTSPSLLIAQPGVRSISPPPSQTISQHASLPRVPSSTSSDFWLNSGLAVWLVGVLAVACRFICGIRGIRYLELHSSRVERGVLAEQVLVAQQALACKEPFQVRLSHAEAGMAVPLTWGWGHPTVLLPSDAESWAPMRQQAVLRHEIAHIARRDWLIQVMAQAVCSLYWFHPLVWKAARSLSAESEQATDDRVLLSGIRPSEYGQYLLEFARSLGATRRTSDMKLLLGMAQSGAFEHRLRALLDPKRNRRSVSGLHLLYGAIGALAGVVLLSMATTQAVKATPEGNLPRPRSSGVMLSSPETTIRSFLEAVNKASIPGAKDSAANIAKAASCVFGSRVNALTPEQRLQLQGPLFNGSIDNLDVRIQGSTATATFITTRKWSNSRGENGAISWKEHLQLQRRAEGWKILPAGVADTPLNLRLLTPLLSKATLLSHVDAASQTPHLKSCGHTLRGLCLSMDLFLQKHGGEYALNSENLVRSLRPYAGSESQFHCPADSSGALSYSFNEHLTNLARASIIQPRNTVMLYEGKDGQLNFRHDGRAMVGFADCSVRSVTPEEARGLRWD